MNRLARRAEHFHGTVEETLNALLDAEAHRLCERRDTRARFG
jgi:hypothetical protein